MGYVPLAPSRPFHWPSLVTNASIAVSERLGFQPYARSVAVRLSGQ